MRLKKMEIENYRQFTDEVINFDKDLTILAGANNSGKTSIVELFKIVFQKKSFSVDDISASKYPELQKKFIDEINTIREECSTKLEFREKIKNKYSGLKDESLTIIKINIEVEYDQDERIFAFSDYLMELDESCKSFYFSYRFEVNANELRNSLSEVSDEFFPGEAQDSKNESNNYGEVLKKIFENSLINKIYFTDKDYQNKQEMSGESFQKLFNMNSVKATRLLDDEKEDRHFSISKELLRHFTASEGWEEFREAIIADIKERLDSRRLNEQIKVHSLDNVQKILNDIENHFDYNKGEFILQTDISDDHLMNFLSSTLQTVFEFKDDVRLKEFSQGLGITNLIFICLKVESFIKHCHPDTVNLFIIEEPEAHMHPQMERMLIGFIKEILKTEGVKIQGVVTTHSSVIVKCSDLNNIRVLRIKGDLKSSVHDMHLFKQSLSNEEERRFFSFLFTINYSDLVFANKIVMYEGDTEKLFIEKLLTDPQFQKLANQYIAFVQVGGAYAHWYRKLIHFLNIKTLIITDMDYTKKLVDIDEIKKDTGITNAGLIEYYRDNVTQDLIRETIIPYCEEKCDSQLEDCFFTKDTFDQIELIRSDLREKPCPKIKKPDYRKVNELPAVNDIIQWKQSSNHPLIKVVTQGEEDAYTRTLEEAMLCKLLDITLKAEKDVAWWDEQVKHYRLLLSIPTKKDTEEKSSLNVRDILRLNEKKKTDFMYSIILGGHHIDALPNYIEEGLKWMEN